MHFKQTSELSEYGPREIS